LSTVLEAPAHKSETLDLRHDGVVRKANGCPPNQDRSELRWLKVTVRASDSRRDNLELTHWKKVWRSMHYD